MALQIRRGTNVQRLLYTPLVGELVFVTDYLTAGVDPIYIGDGVTLGGVAVGQNAVLSGDMEDDINLNSHNIVGTGNLNFTGNVNNVGTTTTKKITITGDGGIAVVSTGTITNTGNVNVSGDIISSGKIQAVTVESDLVGSVISSDSTEVLVNATTNSFSGSAMSLSAEGTSANIVVNGQRLEYNNADIFANFEYGTESNPISFTQYEQYPNIHYGRIVEGGGDITSPGINAYTTYRGTLAAPANIQTGDRLGGTTYKSFSDSNGVGDPLTSPVLGFAGGYAFIAEDQTATPEGIVAATFVLGSGESVAAAFASNTLLSEVNNVLKYTSKGVLGIVALNLRAIGNAERTALTPFINEGTIIYNYEPTNSNADPLGQGGLQVRVGSGWYNIPVSGASNV